MVFAKSFSGTVFNAVQPENIEPIEVISGAPESSSSGTLSRAVHPENRLSTDVTAAKAPSSGSGTVTSEVLFEKAS